MFIAVPSYVGACRDMGIMTACAMAGLFEILNYDPWPVIKAPIAV